jgi:hypothetical protein
MLAHQVLLLHTLKTDVAFNVADPFKLQPFAWTPTSHLDSLPRLTGVAAFVLRNPHTVQRGDVDPSSTHGWHMPSGIQSN